MVQLILETYVQPSGVLEKHVVLKLVWFLRINAVIYTFSLLLLH